ncbi:PREDICTED: uncharacterized protein LOC109387436 [Hipposideros armiger]|uniref:Uncharacterized protein LOC109387436 n=1 Tax=Hipposideros armiger TaxID=186990 RepID=A0A8B7S0K1_HIPAR|nr:PREDICTED: uncharacterized protein LOC109387436 [Hipposideros armiger]
MVGSRADETAYCASTRTRLENGTPETLSKYMWNRRTCKDTELQKNPASPLNRGDSGVTGPRECGCAQQSAKCGERMPARTPGSAMICLLSQRGLAVRKEHCAWSQRDWEDLPALPLFPEAMQREAQGRPSQTEDCLSSDWRCFAGREGRFVSTENRRCGWLRVLDRSIGCSSLTAERNKKASHEAILNTFQERSGHMREFNIQATKRFFEKEF